ncbi:hypothetical protein [Streptomyces murinus]|uniref:hypothetical protein n=1 Tax=Streptomyces murinus TaxID=33900 RepID=UPI0021153DF8|nr:hypothetical protein [Streptomyces murinus]
MAEGHSALGYRSLYGGWAMRRWWKVWCAAVAVLALAGWLCAPYVKDRWLLRTACDGALPSGPVRQLAAGDGHFAGADTTEHAGLGDYGCDLRFAGHGDATWVVRMSAYTRRDDRDAEFLLSFPQDGFSPVYPLAGDLPGVVDDAGELQFLLRCPALGKDAAGRPRRMLVVAAPGKDTTRAPRAVYETVVPLVNSASRHLGCGAKPLTVPKDTGSALPDSAHPPRGIPVSGAAGTGCGWAARARLPLSGNWQVQPLLNDTSPGGRCDLTLRNGTAGQAELSLAAWYGDWSDRLVTDSGVRMPLTATARCDGEAANFAIRASKSIGDARRRVLLRSFAEDQVERHGCSGLRLTG